MEKTLEEPMATSRTDSITDQLSELRSAIATSSDNAGKQTQLLEELLQSLSGLKSSLLVESEKPLLLDLLLFYDSLNWFMESIVKQEMSPDVIEESFQYLIDELVELLYRRNVTPMDPSDHFEASRHRAIQVVMTDEEARHNQITQILKRGFLHADVVLRREEVIVSKLSKDV